MIQFNNWSISSDSKYLTDNVVINVSGSLPAGYTWYVLLGLDGNIVEVPATVLVDGSLIAPLSGDMVHSTGYCTVQLRGVAANGAIKLTNIISNLYVPLSVVNNLSAVTFSLRGCNPEDICDDGNHLVIDRNTKEILGDTIYLNQYDHNSERVTFELPKLIDGHDMLTCDRISVHYITPSSSGMSLIEDISVDPNNADKVIGSWLITQNVTKTTGKVHFIVRFECLDDDTVVYVWSSAICDKITVRESFYNDEDVVDALPDVLEQWKQEVLGAASDIMDIAEDVFAAADAVMEVADTVVGVADRVTVVEKRVDDAVSAIERNSKRLTNIECGIIPEPLETDCSVAYTKDIPVDACPYAKISKIGGMTRKSENLIPYPYASTTQTKNGVTFTDNGDGSITVNGTATSDIYYLLNDVTYEANKTYKLHGCPIGGSKNTYRLYDDVISFIDSGNGANISLSENKQGKIYIYIGNGTTVTNLVFKPMLNAGSTALPYEPYFEGLRSATVTELKLVGANLFNDKAWFKANQFVEQDDGSWFNGSIDVNCFTNTARKSGAMTMTVIGKAVTKDAIYFKVFYTNGDWEAICDLPVSDEFVTVKATTNPNLTVDYIRWTWGVKDAFYVKGVSISFADTSEYIPYTETSFPVPADAQALDGYGWGLSESVYTYIDFNEKHFAKKVGRADMGTLWWSVYQSGNGLPCFWSEDLKAVASYPNYNSVNNILCGKYKNVPANTVSTTDKAISISNNGRLYITDSDYTDAATLRAALAGEMLYYELAEPEIIDISDILSVDNYIEAEGGGTITAVNEYEIAVPTEITYRLKGSGSSVSAPIYNGEYEVIQ